MPKRCFWNLLKTKKKGCLKQGKPLRNVRLGSLQATRPNSRKRCLGRACEKAEPQQVLCPSHCETAAGKMPKRRCWNPLERKKYMPKPCETAARKLPKRCFWNLRKMPKREKCRNVAFGTYLKTKKKGCLKQGKTFAQRKTWKPASHQTKLKKKVFGTRMRKGRTPAGFVPKPLRNRSRKNAETSLLEPIKKKEIVPKPCETAARKLPKRCFWNLLKTKKKPASHQAKLKKKVFGTRMRKSRTPAGFVPKPLRNRSQKNAETSLLEPTKKKEV